jgi:hypothetical protein
MQKRLLPRIFGEEADEIRKAFLASIALAEEKGLVMELPFEIPDFDPPAKKINDTKKRRFFEFGCPFL